MFGGGGGGPVGRPKFGIDDSGSFCVPSGPDAPAPGLATRPGVPAPAILAEEPPRLKGTDELIVVWDEAMELSGIEQGACAPELSHECDVARELSGMEEPGS